jgi:hypothetical protein
MGAQSVADVGRFAGKFKIRFSATWVPYWTKVQYLFNSLASAEIMRSGWEGPSFEKQL